MDMSEMNNVQQVVTKTFNKFDGLIQALKKTWVGSLATVGASLFSVAKYAYSFLDTQAEIDIGIRNLAKAYMVSTDAMLAFENARKELDISYEDLFYATDETRQRFNELVKLGREVEAPEGLEDTLRVVRDISFEFQRLHIIIQNRRRWIAYYIGQFAGPELQQAREIITELVNKIRDGVPYIAEKTGKLLSYFVKLFPVIASFAKTAYTIISKVFEVLASVFRLIKNIISNLELSGAKTALTSFAESIVKLFTTISDGIIKLLSLLNISVDSNNGLIKFLQFVIDLFTDLLNVVNFVIDSLLLFKETISGVFTGDFSGAKETYGSLKNDVGEMNGFKTIGDFFKMITNPSSFVVDKMYGMSSNFSNDTISPDVRKSSYNQTQNNTFNNTYNVNSTDEVKSLQQQNIENTVNNVKYFASPVRV